MNIAKQRLGFVIIACHLFLIPDIAIGAESSSWVQVGKRLKAYSSTFTDVVASRHALNPSLTGGIRTPYLTWGELNVHGVSHIYVKYWRQNRWLSLGGAINLDADYHALDPAISVDGSDSYIAWIELNKHGDPQLHVKRWTKNGWVLVGKAINSDPTRPAANPSITFSAGRPYLAWAERDANRVYQIHVKSLTENGWVKLGGILNEDPAQDAIEPSISMVGSTPYVVWNEKNADDHFQIYVKRWIEKAWVRTGESLNHNPSAHALSPSIASNGDTPYVAWAEFNGLGIFQVYVKRWVDGTWVDDGGSLNMNLAQHALSPSLAFKDKTPYVAWAESNSEGIPQIHVKRWTGSDWAPDAEGLNLDASKPASGPTLAAVEGGLYLAWKETDGTGLFGIVVKARQE